MVLAGGTSMVPGFTERFAEKFRASRFPVTVGEIFQADDPLYAVAKGALTHAQASEEEDIPAQPGVYAAPDLNAEVPKAAVTDSSETPPTERNLNQDFSIPQGFKPVKRAGT